MKDNPCLACIRHAYQQPAEQPAEQPERHLRKLEVQHAELNALAAEVAQLRLRLRIDARAPRGTVVQQLELAEVEVVCRPSQRRFGIKVMHEYDAGRSSHCFRHFKALRAAIHGLNKC